MPSQSQNGQNRSIIGQALRYQSVDPSANGLPLIENVGHCVRYIPEIPREYFPDNSVCMSKMGCI